MGVPEAPPPLGRFAPEGLPPGGSVALPSDSKSLAANALVAGLGSAGDACIATVPGGGRKGTGDRRTEPRRPNPAIRFLPLQGGGGPAPPKGPGRWGCFGRRRHLGRCPWMCPGVRGRASTPRPMGSACGLAHLPRPWGRERVGVRVGGTTAVPARRSKGSPAPGQEAGTTDHRSSISRGWGRLSARLPAPGLTGRSGRPVPARSHRHRRRTS